MFLQLMFGRDDPIPMVSGIDARSDRGGSEAERERYRGDDDDPQRASLLRPEDW